MKKYNIQNYIRYKEDLKISMPIDKPFNNYTRNEMIVKFLPLVESLARKFSTSQQASGVLSINDFLQIGAEALTRAVDKLDWHLRRKIDAARGDIRIPEHKLNEIRKDNGKDHKMVAMFFNSIFLSIDAQPVNNDGENVMFQIPDKSEPYNIQLLNIYLKGLMTKYLNEKEYQVLRLSYGLDCEKHSAKEIAAKLNIDGVSNYVRVSELKKQAVDKLIDSVDHSQVLDYL